MDGRRANVVIFTYKTPPYTVTSNSTSASTSTFGQGDTSHLNRPALLVEIVPAVPTERDKDEEAASPPCIHCIVL